MTSRKDQEQYWFNKKKQYKYIKAEGIEKSFRSFHAGRDMYLELAVPYDRDRGHPAALVRKKYGLSKKELFRACLDREALFMKRSAFIYICKSIQVSSINLKLFIPLRIPPQSLFDPVVHQLTSRCSLCRYQWLQL